MPVTFATGDAVAPAFTAASFDAIISRHLIWTLRDVDVALTAWRRLLRPGGRVVAIDGFWFTSEPEGGEGLFESFYDRQARASLPGWRYCDPAPIMALFERAGFTRLAARPLEEIYRAAAHRPSSRPSYALLGFAEAARPTRRHILWGARVVGSSERRDVARRPFGEGPGRAAEEPSGIGTDALLGGGRSPAVPAPPASRR